MPEPGSDKGKISVNNLRNDLYCVGWGVKLYSFTHSPCQRLSSLSETLLSLWLVCLCCCIPLYIFYCLLFVCSLTAWVIQLYGAI